MTAEIFPLSPKSPDFHVMFSGAAGWPATATRPVTGPEAQPKAAPASRQNATTRPTPLRFMHNLQGVDTRKPG
jgi:hypothetical protein